MSSATHVGLLSSARGWSITTTDKKILRDASTVRAEMCESTCHNNTGSSLQPPRHIPPLYETTFFSSPCSLIISLSFLHPDPLDVCVRSGELPGPLYGDHRRVHERVWYRNGQGALSACRLWAVSSQITYCYTHTPTWLSTVPSTHTTLSKEQVITQMCLPIMWHFTLGILGN